MVPSLGRIVHYSLSDSDVASIPDAASALNAPRAGDVYPMLIVRVWGDAETSSVNGRVFLDGRHDLWVTSRSQGSGAGSWFEAPRVTKADDPAQLVSDHTKAELRAAAAVAGVDVPSGATKADIAKAIATADEAEPREVCRPRRALGTGGAASLD
jgi:hypothetical protein